MESQTMGGELWNHWHLPPPEPFTVKTTLTIAVRRKVPVLREKLYIVRQGLSDVHVLNVEAATLSRFLYRNYRSLRKDKGFQHLKMIMSSLNKYLRMDVVGSIDLIRQFIPFSFSLLADTVDLPSQTALGWILSRIQALAALFYRVFKLTKRAGKFLYQRLRLGWSPAKLVLSLGIAARLHVLSRHLVLQAVTWHTSIIPSVRSFPKCDNNPYKNYPRDLKAWMGGLEDLVIATATTTTNNLDLVFQLVDLTADDEDRRQFIDLLQDCGEDDEIQRLYEVVALDTTAPVKIKSNEVEEEEEEGEILVEFESVQKRVEAEDIGEPVGSDVVPLKKRKRKSVEWITDVHPNVAGKVKTALTGGKKRKRKSGGSPSATVNISDTHCEVGKGPRSPKKLKKLKASTPALDSPSPGKKKRKTNSSGHTPKAKNKSVAFTPVKSHKKVKRSKKNKI